MQGFGVGGEWGGAVLMAVEHAPPGQRGFYGSWPQIGVPAGLLTSTIVFTLFSRLPQDQFLAWGWRVPFLISIVLVGVGLHDPPADHGDPGVPEDEKRAKPNRASRSSRSCKTHPKEVLQAAGARCAENGSFYIYSAFMLVYATQHSHIDRNVALNGIMLASALRVRRHPGLRCADRSHRPPSGLHVRRDHDGRPRVPAVLALRHGLDARWRRSRCC